MPPKSRSRSRGRKASTGRSRTRSRSVGKRRTARSPSASARPRRTATSPEATAAAATAARASYELAPRSSGKLFILGQMLVCVTGIYSCFSVWSLKQERIMTKPYAARGAPDGEGATFPSVFGVGFAQSVAGMLVAAVILLLRPLAARVFGGAAAGAPSSSSSSSRRARGREEGACSWLAPLAPRHRADLREISMVGLSTALGATLGYASMRRLPFPVVLATKMSKMVPLMVVGFLCYRTRYSARKVLSCAMITTGILAFYLLGEDGGRGRKSNGHTATATAAPSNGLIGFALLFINLFLDGFANSTQDVLVKRRGWGAMQLMLWGNLSSAVWALKVMLLLEGGRFLPPSVVHAHPLLSNFAFQDLSKTVRFLHTHPDAARDLIAMSFLNAMGQIFVFQTISLFGTLTLTAMTLVRKAGSVLLSIAVHGHRVRRPQWVALALVMVSVVFEAHVNITEAAERRKKDHRDAARRSEGDSARQSRSPSRRGKKQD